MNSVTASLCTTLSMQRWPEIILIGALKGLPSGQRGTKAKLERVKSNSLRKRLR